MENETGESGGVVDSTAELVVDGAIAAAAAAERAAISSEEATAAAAAAEATAQEATSEAVRETVDEVGHVLGAMEQRIMGRFEEFEGRFSGLESRLDALEVIEEEEPEEPETNIEHETTREVDSGQGTGEAPAENALETAETPPPVDNVRRRRFRKI